MASRANIVFVTILFGLSCDSAPNAGNFPEQVADVLCATNNHCCQLIGKKGGDDSLCHFSVAGGMNVNKNAQLDAVFNPDLADACLKAARAWSCNEPQQNLDDLCRLVYSGGVPIGGYCDDVFETCAQKPGANAICTMFTDKCAPIVLLGHAGAACDTLHPLTCAFFEGLWCMPNQPRQQEGTCRPRLKAGDVCTDNDQCGVNLYCDRRASKCQPVLAKDELCSDPNSCGPSFACVGPTPSAPATCTPNTSLFSCEM